MCVCVCMCVRVYLVLSLNKSTTDQWRQTLNSLSLLKNKSAESIRNFKLRVAAWIKGFAFAITEYILFTLNVEYTYI